MQTNQSQWKLLRELFWSFFKISPISFGGGYAMIPVIEREVVERRRWVTREQMSEIVSVGSAFPGGIAVNISALIGYRLLGWRGIFAAVFGMMIPTFVIILLLTIFFAGIRHHPKVIAAIEGIQIAVVALIAYAGIRLMRTALFDASTITIFVVALLTLILTGLHPILIILSGIAAGFLIINAKKKLGITVRYQKPAEQQKERKTTAHKKYQYQEIYYGEGI